jgi:GAF domain-containing protein
MALTLIFLSSDEAQYINLKRIIPASINLFQVKTIPETFQYIQDEKFPPFLVIMDARKQVDLSIYCRDIAHGGMVEKIPVVVMIDSPEDREIVLNNGADGYLLSPLIPCDVLRCIGQHQAFYELSQIYGDAQGYLGQMAYMVLIAKIVVESSDLETILSKALQQIVNIFTAEGGEIWLLSEDDQMLYLNSSLFIAPLTVHRTQQYPQGRGLIGWTLAHKKALVVETVSTDARYDAKLDHINSKMDHCQMAAVNLRLADKKIGVLSLYRQSGKFQVSEITLLTEIASLVAAGIEKAQAFRALNFHIEQQRVLYEMSQHISSGLELNATLGRIAQWIGRLTDGEIGLIWLVNESDCVLLAVAGFGMELPENPASISLDEFNYNRTSIVINDPQQDPFTSELARILDMKLQNALILPIKQRGNLLGMVTVFNKVSGPFVEAEQKLLSTAIEMIAISISNAKLYNQTRSLMDEKERLHQRALQNERLRTIGRLTASVAHEINNPMQAIRGALSLSLEEINNPAEVQEYIRLSQQEANRVIKLVNRMRQLYRPTNDQAEEVQVLSLLREALETARDEMNRQNVKLSLGLPFDQSPVCIAIANHLHLAFLTILLNLTDAIGEAGGGNLFIKLFDMEEIIRIDFIIQPPIDSSFDLTEKPEAAQTIESQVEMISGYSSVVDAITANGGKINLIRSDEQTVIRVDLYKNKPD